MVLGYTFTSTILAILGIAFAYFVSLPAALHFLTNIGLKQVTALLTIDAYMSFIIAYLLAGALLFQLPLIMVIINTVTPLSPKKLMNYQRHVIVGSFIVAALISPTPDAVNQAILAAPMILMYQIGILIIWFKRRSANKQVSHGATPQTATVRTELHPKIAVLPKPAFIESPAITLAPGQVLLQEITPSESVKRVSPAVGRPAHLRQHANAQLTTRNAQSTIDGLVRSSRQPVPQPVAQPTPHIASLRPSPRSLDGFFVAMPN